ncbi:hypothetical protein G7046_g5132 [Stylonectria norvegica]|nr:hypothetical protein G7046_g5132 [Stylonectria norvegica]
MEHRRKARVRLDELSREVKDLRQSLGNAASRSNAQQQDNIEETSCSSPQDTDHSLEEVDASQIGDCVFSRDELISIFSTFVATFYGHLPIVELPITPRQLQQSSPFLFWTLVMIVVQRAPSVYPGRSQALEKAYTPLLAEAILATPLALPTIQALLFLSSWPLAVQYQARDASWTLAGIVVNSALYSGLHKPTNPQSLRCVGVFVDSPSRLHVWLASFYVSTSLSQAIGVPPTLSSLEHLSTISRMASDERIPRNLACLAEIQACTAKYTSLVTESASLNLAALLEPTFKQDLDNTKNRYIKDWSPNLEFVFLNCKLHIIATRAISQDQQLSPATRDSSDAPIDPAFIASLLDGFHCAIRMIKFICSDQEVSRASRALDNHVIPGKDLYMRGLPKLYFRGLMFATFCILRYQVPLSSFVGSDTNNAREHVEMARDYLRRQSVRPNDEAGRSTAVIETLSMFATAPSGSTSGTIKIKERFGASVFYDALTKAGELRHRPVRLFSDQEQPQRKLVVQTSLVNADDTGIANTESEGEDGQEDGGYLANLPEDWMEHFDLDMMELSGDLFTGATMFS